MDSSSGDLSRVKLLQSSRGRVLGWCSFWPSCISRKHSKNSRISPKFGDRDHDVNVYVDESPIGNFNMVVVPGKFCLLAGNAAITPVMCLYVTPP